MLKTVKKKKIKWSSTQLTESNDYIKVFIKALSQYLPLPERQTIYMISRFFVDGTIEVKHNRFTLAEHLFSRGEGYMAQVPDGTLSKKILINIYDRSKSLYYYRLRKYDLAIQLIDSALKTNKELEKQGLDFLVFDRCSQLHNLSRIYFSLRQKEKGMDILSGVIDALMTGQSNEYVDALDGFIDKLDEEGLKMRSSFLFMLVFETIEQLQSEESLDILIGSNTIFFQRVAASTENFRVRSDADEGLKEWLRIMNLFHERKIESFQEEAIAYLTAGTTFHGKMPGALMINYLTRLPGLS